MNRPPLERRPGDCGADEAGRGAWAGPVVAAAVILPPGEVPPFDDSKRLSRPRREEMAAWIRRHAHWRIALASAQEVDELNVLRASLAAMASAANGLGGWQNLWVDGAHIPRGLTGTAHAVVAGDGRILEIAAASILAKVARDEIMSGLALTHIGYGFERHFGYGTPAHIEALHRLGPCPEHRRTFGPIRERLGMIREAIRT